jgi:hypothetical protein
VVQPLAFLDARPLQNSGARLVEAVLQALENLPDDGVLKLLARSQPDDLIAQLRKRGYKIKSHQEQEGSWDIEVLGADTPDIVDLRGLEAPEPMQQILLAASRLGPDKTYLARLPHVPHPLFPLLRERGLRWWVHEEVDHSALLAVRAAP